MQTARRWASACSSVSIIWPTWMPARRRGCVACALVGGVRLRVGGQGGLRGYPRCDARGRRRGRGRWCVHADRPRARRQRACLQLERSLRSAHPLVWRPAGARAAGVGAPGRLRPARAASPAAAAARRQPARTGSGEELGPRRRGAVLPRVDRRRPAARARALRVWASRLPCAGRAGAFGPRGTRAWAPPSRTARLPAH